MPLLEYTLIINGSIEVDNAIHMLDEEGIYNLIAEDVNMNRHLDMSEVEDLDYQIFD